MQRLVALHLGQLSKRKKQFAAIVRQLKEIPPSGSREIDIDEKRAE